MASDLPTAVDTLMAAQDEAKVRGCLGRVSITLAAALLPSLPGGPLSPGGGGSAPHRAFRGEDEDTARPDPAARLHGRRGIGRGDMEVQGAIGNRGSRVAGRGRILRNLRQDLPPESLASHVAAELAKLPPPHRSKWRRLWANPQQPRTVWAYRAAIFWSCWAFSGNLAPCGATRGRSRRRGVHECQDGVPSPGRPRAPGARHLCFLRAQSQVRLPRGNLQRLNPEKTPMNRGKDGTWSIQVEPSSGPARIPVPGGWVAI